MCRSLACTEQHVRVHRHRHHHHNHGTQFTSNMCTSHLYVRFQESAVDIRPVFITLACTARESHTIRADPKGTSSIQARWKRETNYSQRTSQTGPRPPSWQQRMRGKPSRRLQRGTASCPSWSSPRNHRDRCGSALPRNSLGRWLPARCAPAHPMCLVSFPPLIVRYFLLP
jgi:hypothetical protein